MRRMAGDNEGQEEQIAEALRLVQQLYTINLMAMHDKGFVEMPSLLVDAYFCTVTNILYDIWHILGDPVQEAGINRKAA